MGHHYTQNNNRNFFLKEETFLYFNRVIENLVRTFKCYSKALHKLILILILITGENVA